MLELIRETVLTFLHFHGIIDRDSWPLRTFTCTSGPC